MALLIFSNRSVCSSRVQLHVFSPLVVKFSNQNQRLIMMIFQRTHFPCLVHKKISRIQFFVEKNKNCIHFLSFFISIRQVEVNQHVFQPGFFFSISAIRKRFEKASAGNRCEFEEHYGFLIDNEQRVIEICQHGYQAIETSFNVLGK